MFLLLATRPISHAESPPPQAVQQPSSYAELIALPPEAIKGYDIALINLLCAKGLPGAESLDVSRELAVLDQWAAIVKEAERRYLPSFHRNPARYDGSLSVFKAVNLALTLKQDVGCGYNMDLVKSGAMADIHSTRFFRDSKDLFLHGCTRRKQGSCASLPVLMVAIGRRCGYPLHLVACKGHLFCRWDDGTERFNIETAIEGVDTKPDVYYRSWPHPFDDAEMKAEKYLKTFDPFEELGVFSQLRAACLQEHGKMQEAVTAYTVALQAFPESQQTRQHLSHLQHPPTNP